MSVGLCMLMFEIIAYVDKDIVPVYKDFMCLNESAGRSEGTMN
jgi:hypothetical protein